MDEIQNIIEKQKRGSIRYVFPVETDNNIAIMISILANNGGGKIYLGIKDTGTYLEYKGYSFRVPDQTKIQQYLGGFKEFKINKQLLENKCLIEIIVDSASQSILFKGKLFKFMSDYHNDTKQLKALKIFISYNHKVSDFADILENQLNTMFGPQILISRDTRLKYKDNIDLFMESIKTHDFIISLISDSYLKSEACMYEITELMRDEHYTDKLAFITFDAEDNKLVNSSVEIHDLVPTIHGELRFDYQTFWNKRINIYQNKLAELGDNRPETHVEILNTIRRLNSILIQVGPFIEMLNSTFGKTFHRMNDDNFFDISDLIKEAVKEKN